MAGYKFMNESLKINDRVRALLKELTIDEKLGRLTTYSQPVERLGLKGFPVVRSFIPFAVCTIDSFARYGAQPVFALRIYACIIYDPEKKR